MKKIFYITMFCFLIALAVILSLLPGVDALHSKTAENTGYIKNIQNETIVLILNNRFSGEISSRNNRNKQISTNPSPLISASQSENTLFNNGHAKISDVFGYNLSIDKQRVHQIRAP